MASCVILKYVLWLVNTAPRAVLECIASLLLNSMEGLYSLIRSWGIPQYSLSPWFLSLFCSFIRFACFFPSFLFYTFCIFLSFFPFYVFTFLWLFLSLFSFFLSFFLSSACFGLLWCWLWASSAASVTRSKNHSFVHFQFILSFPFLFSFFCFYECRG